VFKSTYKLKDKDVRNALLRSINKKYANDSNTIVLNELGLLQGLCRIDVAVLNGIMHGYEIKSDSDTLERLPLQAEYYSKVLDKITLVVGEKHLSNAEKIIPEWWGIKVAVPFNNCAKIKSYRRDKINRNVDAYSVVELLWRQEILDILKSNKKNNGILKQPKAKLYDMLVEEYSLNEIRNITRTILKTRTNWRDH